MYSSEEAASLELSAAKVSSAEVVSSCTAAAEVFTSSWHGCRLTAGEEEHHAEHEPSEYLFTAFHSISPVLSFSVLLSAVLPVLLSSPFASYR